MRILPIPNDSQPDVLALCLSATDDPHLHGRLSAICSNLAEAAEIYATNAAQASLNLIPRVQTVGTVTKPELTGL